MGYSIEIKLKQLMDQKNMTQKHLAVLTGLRESTISDIARNSRTGINFAHLSKIAEALKVTDISEIIDFV